MYITITPQKLTAGYSQSSADYVEYLKKENSGLAKEEMELFFNQHGDQITAKEVIKEIDKNERLVTINQTTFWQKLKIKTVNSINLKL